MANYCIECGASISEKSKFCNMCGAEQPTLPVHKKKTEPKRHPDAPSYVTVAQKKARSQQEKTGVGPKWIIILALIIIVFFGTLMNLNNNGKSSTQSSQARFVLSGFSVTPDEVVVGDPFLITVTVSNTGGSQGTHTLKVLVNDVQISSQNIRLSPNKAETIKFQHITSECGEYEVEVGEKSETVLTVLKIGAGQLRAEYEENEVAADEKYEDKILYVYSVIDDIGKDILDTPYITLEDGTTFNSVQCMFKKTDESILAGLKKGQEVTVRGKCEGKAIFGNILLRGSSIIDK